MTLTPLLVRNARLCLEHCVLVKPDETVLFITDVDHLLNAQVFAGVAYDLGAKSIVMDVTPQIMVGKAAPEEPSAFVPLPPMAAAIRTADATVCICDEQYAGRIHMTDTFKESRDAKKRLPVIEEGIEKMYISLDDIMEIKRVTEKFAEATKGEWVRVRSDRGTDITFSLKGREPEAVHPIGNDYGPIPAWGEVAYAVVEGTAEGRVVIDGLVVGVGVVQEPIEWVVKKGRVVEIRGAEDAAKLRKIIERADENANCVAEFGVGTSRKEVLGGPCEKGMLGTMHFALGSNIFGYRGGTIRSNIHIDCVVREPIIETDGRVIFERTEMKI